MTDELDFLVRRDDLSSVRWAEGSARRDELAEGDVLLRIDRFGLTANNITYAVIGDVLGYWSFFPAPDGWGRIPVWGFADVVASRAPGSKEGDRVFGYLPISTFLKVRAGEVTAHGFVDRSEHRQQLPAVYQRYVRAERTDVAAEDQRILFSPLFGTGYLIDDWLAEEKYFGARQITIASASSKTALATAFNLSRRPGRDYEIVALTSPRNRAFCERVGFYDRVVSYDEIASLRATARTVHVDMAGDPKVLLAVHAHFGPSLKYSCSVGMTHQPATLAPPAGLDGPTPKLFFAPTHVEQRQKDWGVAELGRRIARAQQAFLESAASWLELTHGRGRDAIESAYRTVLAGRAEPHQGHILSL